MKLKELKESSSEFLTDFDDIQEYFRNTGIFNFNGRWDVIDGKVSVVGDLHIMKFPHTRLQVQFGQVNGDFMFDDCQLTTLVGFPEEVHGTFYIQKLPHLKSLEGGPRYALQINIKDMASLETLKGFPEKVYSSIRINRCHALKDINDLPDSVNGDMDLSSNSLTFDMLQGLPSTYTQQIARLDLSDNYKLLSIEGISDIVLSMQSGSIKLDSMGIRAGGIGLILIPGLVDIWTDGFVPHFNIIRDYLGKPDEIFECQNKLIEAGYEEYAKL